MERKSALTIQLLRELIRQLQECTWVDPPLGLETEIDPEIEIAGGAPVHTPGTVVAVAAIDQDQGRDPFLNYHYENPPHTHTNLSLIIRSHSRGRRDSPPRRRDRSYSPRRY